MDFSIRKMVDGDRDIVVDMMRRFYNSPALITNGSEKIYANDVDACLSNSPYIEGYVFVVAEKVVGYAMLAKSFSTEFGGECIWIEDIYLQENFRGRGFGSKFIQFVKDKYHDKILRLEAEHGNDKALNVYRRMGFFELPYLEFVLTRT